ncbi:PepSY domain-containing protein [Pseudochrobactrum sp. MP213Fo]|uniref:PepSY domain-containing protein n=1 Tax=Pseudochrobactrum sp. MP213Fo TaxID=3022250 RepID=UPI003B9E5E98
MRIKTLLAGCALALATLSAQAQNTPATVKPSTTETPAITTPDAVNPNAPVPGENSFTESQAKSRFEEAGYTDVTNLNLVDGIWHAEGVKNSTSLNLNLDYQGNITEAAK